MKNIKYVYLASPLILALAPGIYIARTTGGDTTVGFSFYNIKLWWRRTLWGN